MADQRIKLYRAVSAPELTDLEQNLGIFRDSPHSAGEKGFFFEREAAIAFAQTFGKSIGVSFHVFETESDPAIIQRGRVHDAAMEGAGVYLLAGDLARLTPAKEVKE